MAQQELYDNWLCPPPLPGKRPVRQTDSSDSFSNEEDYDDVSLSEMGDQMQKRLPAYKDNTDIASQRSKKGTGFYVLAGKPASSSLPRTANPIPDSNQGIGYRPKSIVILYVLMGICFAMWAVLLSLAVVKYLEMSEELKVLNCNHSERLMNVEQDLADARIERKRIMSDMNKNYKELSDFTASICNALPEPIKCAAGWKKFEKACYFFSNMTNDWMGAKQFCTDQNSYLVIVNNDYEQAFLNDYNKLKRTYWLGLSDAVEERKWQWVDNSPYSVSFWNLGEPDMQGEEEDCVSMRSTGTWGDSKCSQHNYWICEKTWIC
ncbi:C-type lectin domain family 17, member A-like isoform X2 [Gopherus evgoodei]|uniref:C-type lectin domain family 17, member A-like isoform X2 n=1 Tax=Gopherus evgoodei TaxID=1825980 RepID=UPI0011CFB5B1|nr:C-type lectin domain family 17, member A-like isoform X2 [Gopherus evgoodei]